MGSTAIFGPSSATCGSKVSTCGSKVSTCGSSATAEDIYAEGASGDSVVSAALEVINSFGASNPEGSRRRHRRLAASDSCSRCGRFRHGQPRRWPGQHRWLCFHLGWRRSGQFLPHWLSDHGLGFSSNYWARRPLPPASQPPEPQISLAPPGSPWERPGSSALPPFSPQASTLCTFPDRPATRGHSGSVCRILRQRLHDQVAQQRMNLGIYMQRRHRRAFQNALPQRLRVLAIEGLPLRHHLIENCAQAEQIRPAISSLAPNLLRRHVMQNRRNRLPEHAVQNCPRWKRRSPES